jgi:hypothetical protein
MSHHVITHSFGPWAPPRFIPVPFREEEAPAFWIAVTRTCRGEHDWRCLEAQTLSFGPLVLEADTQVWQCPNCRRTQPDTMQDGTPPASRVCLFCSNSATSVHTADGPTAHDARTAAAALEAAGTALRYAHEADPASVVALLEGTGDSLRLFMESTAQALDTEPKRIKQRGFAIMAMIARQVIANSRAYAELATEPLPITENDDEG